MSRILMLIALCTWTMSACAQESGVQGTGFQEGVNYERVTAEQPAPGKVEVIEFFSYSCPHCASLAPYMHQWEKRQPAHVKVTYIPVVLQEFLLKFAKAHYAAEVLGIDAKAQPLLFEAYHVKQVPLETAEQIAELIAAGTGVDKKKFLETMDSFAVDSSLRRGMQRAQKYRVSGVPALAVNGKYKTSVSMAGGNEAVIKLLDHLVGLESKTRVKPKPAKEAATQ